MKVSLKGLIGAGAAAGAIWGWLSMALNAVSGVFPFEGGFAHNVVVFAVAGALFGVVVAGLLGAAGSRLPFKGEVTKAVFVSTAVWLLLRAGGTMLSAMEPERYHLLTPEFFQGLSLAVVLGVVLGILVRGAGARARTV